MAQSIQTKGTVSVGVGPDGFKMKGDNIPLAYIAVIGLIAVAVFLIYAKYIHKHAVNHVRKVRAKSKARKAARRARKKR